MCNHENQYLIGTADGITCRKCGANFKSFSEIHPEPEKPKEKTRTRKRKEDA